MRVTRLQHKALLAFLLGVAIAVPAFAQQPSRALSEYPVCPDPPPKLTPVEQEAAHASFKVGAEAFKDSDYQKAIDNFKDAFRRDCSKVSLLDFIARSYEGKGDRAEAVHALEVYLQRNPKADDADTIQKRISNLKAQMGASAGTATAPTETATATTTATAPTVTATATSTAPPPETGGHTALPWIVMGVGVVAVGVAIPVGLIGVNKQSAARAGCTGSGGVQVCDPVTVTPSGQDRKSLSSTGAAMGTTGWILGSVGVAAIAGGLIWHFLEPSAKKTALAPVLAPGYGGLSLTGVF